MFPFSKIEKSAKSFHPITQLHLPPIESQLYEKSTSKAFIFLKYIRNI